jgi:hypothetical protein
MRNAIVEPNSQGTASSACAPTVNVVYLQEDAVKNELFKYKKKVKSKNIVLILPFNFR